MMIITATETNIKQGCIYFALRWSQLLLLLSVFLFAIRAVSCSTTVHWNFVIFLFIDTWVYNQELTLVFCLIFFRKDHIHPSLAWNLLCRLLLCRSHRDPLASICLLTVGITGMCHLTWLPGDIELDFFFELWRLVETILIHLILGFFQEPRIKYYSLDMKCDSKGSLC